MRLLNVPQPPAPPSFGSISANNGKSADPTPKTDASAEPPSSESIGKSPVVMAFLLRLQELGLNSMPGTDGDDQLSGWSGTLADGGDGNDSIDVWSDSVVDGGGGDDSIRAWSGSAVYGGDGADQLDVWSDSIIDGGAGNDIIRAWSNTVVQGGDGDDQINAWSESKVDGGDGDDSISAWSNSYVEGGDGDDTIQVHSDSVAIGGRGSDTIALRSANSIARFSAGDGNDTIYTGVNSTIELGTGLNAEETTVEIVNSIATIRFAGKDDSITVHFLGSRPATLSFADGSTMSLVGEVQPGPVLSDLKVELRK